MADTGPKGVAGEVVARAAAELAGAAGEQLAMFPVPTRLAGAAAEELGREIADHHGRGPGRPPGAQNRATRALREYLLGRGVDPLESLARWGMHTPATLARELSCTPLEAFRELRAVWSELAPYLHGRMQPTDRDGRPVPFFNLVLGGPSGAIAAGDRPPWEMAEISHSEPADDGQSQADQSHGEGK